MMLRRASAKRASSAAAKPSKPVARKKLKTTGSAPDVPIKIQVGEGESISVVYIHRSRLEKVSPWFKRTAAHSEVIELDHVSAETLQAFYKWVYDGCVEVEGLEEEMTKGDDDDESEEVDGNANSNKRTRPTRTSTVVDLTEDGDVTNTDEEEDDDEDNPSRSTTPTTLDGQELPWYLNSSLNIRGQIFGRLLDLYTFSVTYEVPSFRLDVMLTWQRFSHKTSTYPCATVIRNVNQRVPIMTGLVQYLIGCYAHYIELDAIKKNRDRWHTIQSEFLTEVLILALWRAEGVDDPDDKPNNQWCEYHEHGTEEEKTECRDKDGRKNDPDVKYSSRPPPRRWGGCC